MNLRKMKMMVANMKVRVETECGRTPNTHSTGTRHCCCGRGLCNGGAELERLSKRDTCFFKMHVQARAACAEQREMNTLRKLLVRSSFLPFANKRQNATVVGSGG